MSPKSQQPIEGENIICKKILFNSQRRILDVGCGDGKWSGHLFKKVDRLDGIEICNKYINKYNLSEKYDKLYCLDVVNFDSFDFYDIIILGDVLEHLSYKNAITLVGKLKQHYLIIYLTIPISRCIQGGKKYDNPYEAHLYQWSHKELVRLGFVQLHCGCNPNGLVKIGTYELINEI